MGHIWTRKIQNPYKLILQRSNGVYHVGPQILETPSLLAEGSAGVRKNIFKEKPPQSAASTSGCCSGYVQGRGPGPKPMSKAHREAEKQRKEAEARAHAAETLYEELQKQVAELKARQDNME